MTLHLYHDRHSTFVQIESEQRDHNLLLPCCRLVGPCGDHQQHSQHWSQQRHKVVSIVVLVLLVPIVVASVQSSSHSSSSRVYGINIAYFHYNRLQELGVGERSTGAPNTAGPPRHATGPVNDENEKEEEVMHHKVE